MKAISKEFKKDPPTSLMCLTTYWNMVALSSLNPACSSAQISHPTVLLGLRRFGGRVCVCACV